MQSPRRSSVNAPTSTQMHHAPRAVRMRWIRQHVAAHVQQRRSPRLFMALTVSVVGLLMFVSSVILYGVGLDLLWLRYLIVWCLGYGLFLVMLRAWLHRESEYFSQGGELISVPSAEDTAPAPGYAGSGGQTSGAGAAGQWTNGHEPAPSMLQHTHTAGRVREPEGPDLGRVDGWSLGDGVDLGDSAEAVPLLVLLLIGLVLALSVFGLVYVVAGLISAAPYLLTELLVDVLISAGLYRRLAVARHAGQYWLLTAWQHTWKFFVSGLVMIGVLAVLLTQIPVPIQHLGQLWRYWF